MPVGPSLLLAQWLEHWFAILVSLLLQSLSLQLRLYSNKPPHEIVWGSKFPRRADQLQHHNEELAGCTD